MILAAAWRVARTNDEIDIIHRVEIIWIESVLKYPMTIINKQTKTKIPIHVSMENGKSEKRCMILR